VGVGAVIVAALLALSLKGVPPLPASVMAGHAAPPPTTAPGPSPIPSPSPVEPRPSGVVAAESSAPASEVLGPLLLSLDREESYRAALGEVQSLWHSDKLEKVAFRTHLDQLRRLDLPVALEMFHPSRKDTCFLALVQVLEKEAIVTGSGGPVRVGLAELDRLWTRQAVFLWRDFDSLVRASDGKRARWTRDSLIRLGYEVTPARLATGVADFQRESELTPDGLVGGKTLMTLYSLGDYPRPRLRPAAGSASP